MQARRRPPPAPRPAAPPRAHASTRAPVRRRFARAGAARPGSGGGASDRRGAGRAPATHAAAPRDDDAGQQQLEESLAGAARQNTSLQELLHRLVTIIVNTNGWLHRLARAAPRNRSDARRCSNSELGESLPPPCTSRSSSRPSLLQVDLPTECINAMALLHGRLHRRPAVWPKHDEAHAAPPALTDNSAPSAADVATSEFMTDSLGASLSPARQLLADVSGSAGSHPSPSRRNQISSVPSDEWTPVRRPPPPPPPRAPAPPTASALLSLPQRGGCDRSIPTGPLGGRRRRRRLLPPPADAPFRDVATAATGRDHGENGHNGEAAAADASGPAQRRRAPPCRPSSAAA